MIVNRECQDQDTILTRNISSAFNAFLPVAPITAISFGPLSVDILLLCTFFEYGELFMSEKFDLGS